jgi:hypothetical protein
MSDIHDDIKDCDDESDIEQTFVALLRVVARMDALQRHSDPYLHSLIENSKRIAARFSNADEQNEEITRQ